MNTNDILKESYRKLGETMLPKFKKRGFEAYYVETGAEALELVKKLIPEGSSTTCGGSQTLIDTGIKELIMSDRYNFIDRDKGDTPEEKRRTYGEVMCADYFLMSTNAFTKDGELVNIDGRGNRLACMCYGPSHVIVVTGINKMTSTVEEAFDRIHNVATPPNCIRLGLNTPCAHTGLCGDCHGKDTICCFELVTRHSKIDGRMSVILIGDNYGF